MRATKTIEIIEIMKKRLFLAFILCFVGFTGFAYTSTTYLTDEISNMKDELRELISRINDLGGDPSENSQVVTLQTQIAQKEQELNRIKRDNRNEELWAKGRYTNIGYMFDQATLDYDKSMKYKSLFGITLTQGTTFYLHKRPIGNFLKFGLDVNWIDFSFGQYKYNGPHNQYIPSSEYDQKYWAFFIGIAGFGPRITFAPFGTSSKDIAYLKIAAYAHYQPTIGLSYYDGYREHIPTKYDNVFQVGARISYKAIGFGVEKDWVIGDFDGDKAKYNSFRLFLSFTL